MFWKGTVLFLKLDNDVLVETVVPSTTQLGHEHSRLGKAKSQVGEKAGHSSISHRSDVRGICSRAAAECSGGSQAEGVRLVERRSCQEGQLTFALRHGTGFREY